MIANMNTPQPNNNIKKPSKLSPTTCIWQWNVPNIPLLQWSIDSKWGAAYGLNSVSFPVLVRYLVSNVQLAKICLRKLLCPSELHCNVSRCNVSLWIQLGTAINKSHCRLRIMADSWHIGTVILLWRSMDEANSEYLRNYLIVEILMDETQKHRKQGRISKQGRTYTRKVTHVFKQTQCVTKTTSN